MVNPLQDVYTCEPVGATFGLTTPTLLICEMLLSCHLKERNVPRSRGKTALKSRGHYVNDITPFLEATLIKYSLTLIIVKLGLKRELKLSGIMAV